MTFSWGGWYSKLTPKAKLQRAAISGHSKCCTGQNPDLSLAHLHRQKKLAQSEKLGVQTALATDIVPTLIRFLEKDRYSVTMHVESAGATEAVTNCFVATWIAVTLT